MAEITHFECSRCGERLPADRPQTLCPKDAGSLYARYDLEALRVHVSRDAVKSGPATMWRYAGVLPSVEPVTLGEGFTPLLRSRRDPDVYIKDEGLNPTGSFKARGLCMAVTMARHYGLRELAIPSAGNAASALAAYCAAAGIEAHIFMPTDVPQANLVECRAYGAHVTLVDGLISDCGRLVAERSRQQGWFDISTLKEPFRVEGKKTMGYEVAEQLGWELPDAIIYPTGGGVGLIGMWKAFDEMEALGWIGKKRPRMVVVQAAGCAPIPRAWEERKPVAEPWSHAKTLAAGLRVPKAYGDYIVLEILRMSNGAAVAATDEEIIEAVFDMATHEGVFAAPEGAAALVAYRKLLEQGYFQRGEKVVLFNTGSGLKYIDVIAGALNRPEPQPRPRAIGG
ncbi:MAG: threonine synthase, partial [Acidobacteria bacterium]|nr:threonine synthase [Acidobacteriota bacterium]